MQRFTVSATFAIFSIFMLFTGSLQQICATYKGKNAHEFLYEIAYVSSHILLSHCELYASSKSIASVLIYRPPTSLFGTRATAYFGVNMCLG